MSKHKRILFSGGGFTRQLGKIVKNVFACPTINEFVAANQGLLKTQASDLGNYISTHINLEKIESWETDIVGAIEKDIALGLEMRQRLLFQAQCVYSDTLGLNYGISPTCPNERGKLFGEVIKNIDEFMDRRKFRAILTTNHDLTLDHWLLGGRGDYKKLLSDVGPDLFGFQLPEEKARSVDHWIEHDGNRYPEDSYSYEGFHMPAIVKPHFYFLKLHGSLNWWQNGNGMPFMTRRIPQWGDGKSIRDYRFGAQEFLMGPKKSTIGSLMNPFYTRPRRS